MTLAVGQLRQVELEQLRLVRGDEHARHLGPGERRLDLLGRAVATAARAALLVRLFQRRLVRAVVQHERVAELELVLDRDLGDALPGGAEPALAHQTVVVSPGCFSTTTPPGAG